MKYFGIGLAAIGCILFLIYAFSMRDIYATGTSTMRCQENELVHYFYNGGKLYAICKTKDGYMIVK